MRSLIILAAYAVALSSTALAQMPQPNVPDSTCDLTIRVRLHNDRAPTEVMEVQLLTSTDISTYEAYTHGDASVEFKQVSPGIYRVRVIGDKYQTTYSDEI